MPFAAIQTDDATNGALILSLVAGEGSGSHGWLHSAELNAGAIANRNLADMLHLLSELHGSQPGIIEVAGLHNVWNGAGPWLRVAASGFAQERAYLTQLLVAAGPAPGTPGEAATIGAIGAQRLALDTIARSDRFGCGIGLVAALLLDWQPIRATLDTAAYRLGIVPPDVTLPGEAETCDVLSSLPERARLDRSLAFGARQLLLHHQALWELLQARAGARLG